MKAKTLKRKGSLSVFSQRGFHHPLYLDVLGGMLIKRYWYRKRTEWFEGLAKELGDFFLSSLI